MSSTSAPTRNRVGSPGPIFSTSAIASPRASSRRVKRRCSSTTRSTFSTPPARQGHRKGRRSRTTTFLNNGYFVGEVLRYTEHDRICVPVPFYHCFGCVLATWRPSRTAARVVIPGESFDADATLRAIEAERCTSIYGVPTMFIAQLDHPRFSSVQLETPAHRHHGRRVRVPIEVMRQRHRPHARAGR